MKPVDSDTYLAALLAAPRAGTGKVLAFYDHRVGCIGKDPRLMLLPLDDHICHRGDGLFESICYRDGKIFVLDAHLARMQDGARALNLTPPCPWDEVRQLILDLARASGQDHGDLRIFLSRGPGGFGVSPRECPQAGLYMVALRSQLPTEEKYLKGLTAFSSAIPPKQEYMARIKNTNYLPNVFMAVEAQQKGMDVAVTFDEQGYMGETAIANLGIVDSQGRLRSPEIRRILPGTTLLAALKLAEGHMPVVQGPIHKDEIATAREMVLFTSATLCLGVTHFDGMPVGQGAHRGKPGPVAFWLRDTLLQYMRDTGTAF